MDRHAPDGLRDDVVQRRARLQRADRALARPRPPRLRGDGALRADQHARAARDGRARCARADPSLYMQTHVAENRAEVALGARAVPRGAQLPRRLRPRRPAARAQRASRTASGSTTPTAPRCATPARRSRTSPSSNLFLGSGLFDWRAASAAGVRVEPGHRRRRRHQPVDAAHAWPMPTRCRRCAGERLTAWKALHAATRGAAQALASATRSARSSRAGVADVCVWDWAVGAGGRRAASRWRAACTSACSRG